MKDELEKVEAEHADVMRQLEEERSAHVALKEEHDALQSTAGEMKVKLDASVRG